MEKRKHKRKAVRIKVRLFWGNNTYPGTVISLSEKGMFIATKTSPPTDSVLEAVLKIEDDHLKVPVHVKYTIRMDGAEPDEKSGMGVMFLDVPAKYLDYFRNLEAD